MPVRRAKKVLIILIPYEGDADAPSSTHGLVTRPEAGLPASYHENKKLLIFVGMGTFDS